MVRGMRAIIRKTTLVVSSIVCVWGAVSTVEQSNLGDFSLINAVQAADVISDIIVDGNQRIEPETIRAYMTVQIGSEFDNGLIDASLKALFSTGLFADVSIRRAGDRLVVSVVENPIINRVAFEGNKAKKDEDLEKEVQLRPRVVYTRAKVQADVQRILELYRRSGRFAAQIEPKLVQLPQNRVDLIFEVSEGPTSGISRINFIGNTHYSDSRLKDEIATSETRWYNFLSSSDNYDPDRVSYDRELLRRFYLSKGYADFRVVSAVAELSRDREDFFVTFTVEEGERYNFGEITVDSQVRDLTSDMLLPLAKTEPGETYNADLIEMATDDMTFAAGERGYAFVDVRPRVKRDRENRLINITYRVDEGPRVYVERININGNVRTLDRVIRREFRFVEGDAFNSAKLERSKSRIRALGFFGNVEINQEPGSQEDRTVVDVEVAEVSTGELAIGAGFSSLDNLGAEFSVTERNLLGRGQFLRLALSASSAEQQIDLRFTEPYFMGKNFSAGFDLFRTDSDFQDTSSFESSATGGSLRFGFPINEWLKLSGRYLYRQDKLINIQASASRAIREADPDTSTSALGYDLVYDKRDDAKKPTRGFDIAFAQDFAGLGGTVKYIKTEPRANFYYPIIEDYTGGDDVILSLQAEGGFINGLGDDVSILDRFFVGGNKIRGFDNNGIGPRDIATDDALGGNAYYATTAAVSFPLGLPEEFGVLGSVFVDAGSLGLLDDTSTATTLEDDFSLRAAAGIGFYWESPFGPIRLDFSEAFLKEDYDKTEFFRFNVGTRF